MSGLSVIRLHLHRFQLWLRRTFQLPVSRRRGVGVGLSLDTVRGQGSVVTIVFRLELYKILGVLQQVHRLC